MFKQIGRPRKLTKDFVKVASAETETTVMMLSTYKSAKVTKFIVHLLPITAALNWSRPR